MVLGQSYIRWTIFEWKSPLKIQNIKLLYQKKCCMMKKASVKLNRLIIVQMPAKMRSALNQFSYEVMKILVGEGPEPLPEQTKWGALAKRGGALK